MPHSSKDGSKSKVNVERDESEGTEDTRNNGSRVTRFLPASKSTMFQSGSSAYERLGTDDDGDEDYGELCYQNLTAPRKIPSVILPSMMELEKRFFDLVLEGNVQMVKTFLKDNKDFSLNVTNFQGMTGLHLATKSGNLEMVELLLAQPGLVPGDCALHAIRDNQPAIAVKVLDRLACISPKLEFQGSYQSVDFPDHITPLILAAQCGHYEMIGMLMERQHGISRPHTAKCKCNICIRNALDEDGLSVFMKRLSAYRALVNPAYICRTSADPILTAFLLCVELHEWSQRQPEFRIAYNKLAADVRRFPVALIGMCRSSQEVALILSQRGGCNFPGQFVFPRLMMAIDYHQKEFVAHPHTQQVLQYAWCGDWYQWRMRSDLMKLLSVIPRILELPFMVLMCVCMPYHKWVTRWRLPANKMLSSISSYIVFLILVFMESNLDKTNQKRGPPDSGLELILIIYVFAYVWSLLRHCMIQGPQRFFHVLSNWYDLLTQLLFVCAFLFWLAAWHDVQVNNQRDLERKYWHYLDPTLIAEGFFTIATIFAYGRLLLLCQLNFHLGPLQVSLGKMTKDIAKFAAIFTIILFAFTAGLSRLYQYYQDMVQENHVTGIKTVQASSFVGFTATVKTLFWGLLCMSPTESADVIIENLKGADNETNIINTHNFTETIGIISFAMYEILTVFVILNMLIATMSNSFQKVTDNVEIEWNFGRTEVYLGYMSKTTLPPPFNIIPTFTGVASMVEWMSLFCTKSPGKRSRFSLTYCCFVEVDEPEDKTKAFTMLMGQVVQRYFNRAKKT